MSSKKGWVKLYRNITEHWVYADPLLLKIWITVLCMANHEPRKISINGNMEQIGIGEFWTSFRKIAQVTCMSVNTVKSKLEQLEEDGMIAVYPKQGVGTRIKVLNYSIYQSKSGVQKTISDTSNDTISDTSNDISNDYKQEGIKELTKKRKKKDLSAWIAEEPEVKEV